jgi:hypothetical protein
MSVYSIPGPPVDAVMPAMAQNVMIGLTGLGAFAVVLLSLREMRRRGDRVPLYVLLGAALAIFYEPVGDMLGMAYYPAIGQVVWIDTFGRKTPLFIALIYFCYFPPFILFFLRALDAGISTARWWRLWAATVLATFLFEPLPVHLGLWLYYGTQPFVVLGFPLYWAFVNASFVFGTAVGTHFVLRGFGGRANWLIVPMMPLFLLFFHGAPSLPVATALNTTDSLVLTSIGGALTIGLSVLLSWMGASLLCTPTPRRRAANDLHPFMQGRS